MALLETAELRKFYGKTCAVMDLELKIERGELFGLLGPNGAGKSTTLGIVTGLLRPTAGQVTIDGISMARDPRRAKRKIGVVPQDIALYPRLSGRANLTFWGEMYGLSGRTLREKVDESLERVGLNDRADERLGSYSGGMKRRANVAASLLHDPELLVLDEPTAGVDPQSRSRIIEMVRELNTQGTTVIYTTHYMEEVEQLCGRIAIMDKGQVIALGTMGQLLGQCGSTDSLLISAVGADSRLLTDLSLLPGVTGVSSVNDEVVITAPSAAEVLPLAFARFQSAGVSIRQIEFRRPSLEALFLSLTGRSLRD